MPVAVVWPRREEVWRNVAHVDKLLHYLSYLREWLLSLCFGHFWWNHWRHFIYFQYFIHLSEDHSRDIKTYAIYIITLLLMVMPLFNSTFWFTQCHTCLLNVWKRPGHCPLIKYFQDMEKSTTCLIFFTSIVGSL